MDRRYTSLLLPCVVLAACLGFEDPKEHGSSSTTAPAIMVTSFFHGTSTSTGNPTSTSASTEDSTSMSTEDSGSTPTMVMATTEQESSSSSTSAESTGEAPTEVDCSALPDGTACGPLQICLAASCVMTQCGDGFVDEAAGEQCEDGNVVDRDGCESNCLWTCESDDDCDDGNVCTGAETCGVDHTCTNPPDLNCDDSNPCTMDTCDPLAGCISTLIDGDGDGFAPESLGACGAGTAGGDCVDTDPTVQPGAFDGCDGMSIDNDCDGQIDEDGTGRWYADCDGDGYAATGAEQRDACAEPESGPTACTGGGWTQAEPRAPNVDCNDNAAGTHPGATEIAANARDENCDGLEVCYIDSDQDGYRTEQVTLTNTNDCRTSAGLALATAPLEWTSSSVADDCCDRDARMHQGQNAYYTTGISSCPTGRRYDYDCDGTEELQYGASYRAGNCWWDGNCSRSYSRTSGWNLDTVPSCGVTTAWVSNCDGCGLFSCCWHVTSARTQGCR